VSDELSIPNPTYRIPRQRRGLDPMTRKLALIACGVGGVLVVGIGGWTVLGHRNTVVPVVQAENGPIRVKPTNPGGMQISGANEDIMSGGSTPGDGKLAPAPEAPNPQGLRSQPPPKPAPAAMAALPAPLPAVLPTGPAKPIAEKPLAALDKHAAVATTPEQRPAPAAGAGTLVQLAAVGSEQAAKDEWQRLTHRLPDLLQQHHAAISKTEHDGRTLWRVRTGGFSDVAQATAFCERIRAKGAGCSVATF
jgi:hypothetical protein